MKEPHYGNEKSSSSSSSDDESHTDAKKEEKTHDSVSIAISHRDEEKKVDTISEVVPHISGKGKPLKEANNNSDVEPAPVINSDTPVVPMSEVVRPVVENLQVESSEFAVSASIENMNKILPVSSETSGVPLGLLSEKGDDTLDEKLTFVEVTSAAATSNDVQIAKESETHECHETRRYDRASRIRKPGRLRLICF
uniref:Uncharacterized protein n=1 Tax=Rhizophora mucronata TaxID=61149 RepID=A0A2P2IRW3_RHIMU